MRVTRSAARNGNKESVLRGRASRGFKVLRAREKEDMVGGHAVPIRETMSQSKAGVGQAADKTTHGRSTWRAGCTQHNGAGSNPISQMQVPEPYLRRRLMQ
jgi:hypothetical protein